MNNRVHKMHKRKSLAEKGCIGEYTHLQKRNLGTVSTCGTWYHHTACSGVFYVTGWRPWHIQDIALHQSLEPKAQWPSRVLRGYMRLVFILTVEGLRLPLRFSGSIGASDISFPRRMSSLFVWLTYLSTRCDLMLRKASVCLCVKPLKVGNMPVVVIA